MSADQGSPPAHLYLFETTPPPTTPDTNLHIHHVFSQLVSHQLQQLLQALPSGTTHSHHIRPGGRQRPHRLWVGASIDFVPRCDYWQVLDPNFIKHLREGTGAWQGQDSEVQG